MAEWLRHREHRTSTEYARHFEWRDTPGAGFSFPCDAQGNIFALEHAAAQGNLAACLDGTFDVIDRGIETYEHHYWEPGAIRCDVCQAEVVLEDSFLNPCTCGADYSGTGQLLAPREQWGEETGESLADILGPEDPNGDWG